MTELESSSTVLGIETATATVGVALLRGTEVVASRRVEAPGDHAARLADLVDEVLAEATLAPTDLDRLAVSTGPGSFTGLRIGIGFAQGFAFAAGTDLVGVPTFPAWAAAVGAPRVAVCVDARRGEVYLGLYACDAGAARALRPERACTPEAAAAAIREAFGVDPFALVGDGAKAYPDALGAVGGVSPEPSSGPSGEAIARFGMALAPSDGRVLPCYLRASEAERKLAATLGSSSR